MKIKDQSLHSLRTQAFPGSYCQAEATMNCAATVQQISGHWKLLAYLAENIRITLNLFNIILSTNYNLAVDNLTLHSVYEC